MSRHDMSPTFGLINLEITSYSYALNNALFLDVVSAKARCSRLKGKNWMVMTFLQPGKRIDFKMLMMRKAYSGL